MNGRRAARSPGVWTAGTAPGATRAGRPENTRPAAGSGGALNRPVPEYGDMSGDLESTSLAQRIVLCCLLEYEEAGETPVNTAVLREAATDGLETADTGAAGSLSEADVMRALNALSGTGLVEEQRPDARSPVGKGRPEYALSAETGRIRKELAADERVAPLLQ